MTQKLLWALDGLLRFATSTRTQLFFFESLFCVGEKKKMGNSQTHTSHPLEKKKPQSFVKQKKNSNLKKFLISEKNEKAHTHTHTHKEVQINHTETHNNNSKLTSRASHSSHGPRWQARPHRWFPQPSSFFFFFSLFQSCQNSTWEIKQIKKKNSGALGCKKKLLSFFVFPTGWHEKK